MTSTAAATPSVFDDRRRALEARFPTWEPRTLGAHLTHTSAEFGDRPLVITDDRTVTYADIDAWATRLADGLASIGVQPGDRVGIVMANYLEFIPLKFAVARVGAVAIPFNYLYQRDELAYVLDQSECNALITMTGFGGLDQLAMLDDICPGWETNGGGQNLPHLRVIVQYSTDGRTRDGVMTVDELDAAGVAAPGGADDSSTTPDDNGDILYTSGTTGSPKGVMVTHDAMQRTAYSSALARAFQDGRRVLFSLPCYHMFGYVEGLLAAMYVGGAIIPRTAFSPEDYLASIERHQATDILAVPTMAVALVEHPDRFTRDLSSCTAILSGAAPAPVWLWEKMRADLGISEITTGYGMTECGGAMTLTRPEDSLETHSTTVGKPKFAGVAGMADNGDLLCEYKTVDPTTGDDLPAGAEGELASRGPTHMLGFWNKPEETTEAVRDGWMLSGDLGRVDDGGYLQLTGRSKELYKSGGELVMPKEVEELLTKQPGVSQAYAIGVPDERWGEVGCAYIVAEDGADLDAEVLLDVCRQYLARFKVPKHILFIDAASLPTTPTGKVQKYRLVSQAVDAIRPR
ncbi:class I adenylate-forming enzyme family protein [uncultured Ilumatobacter sp.]|uniref:class I adenylate-forming enzyme family protein n=1 Tax=uncultured Ilumatobacter sp. TaxID=879968 RepID=UPI00374F5A35